MWRMHLAMERVCMWWCGGGVVVVVVVVACGGGGGVHVVHVAQLRPGQALAARMAQPRL
jgi:hypothetical protein